MRWPPALPARGQSSTRDISFNRVKRHVGRAAPGFREVTTLPAKSTAAQKRTVGHEMPASAGPMVPDPVVTATSTRLMRQLPAPPSG